LVDDLREVQTLLRVVWRTTQRILELTAAIPVAQPGPPRIISGDSQEGRLLVERFERVAELGVLTKALYEWLYHLQEDFEVLPGLLASELKQRLDRYCAFRNGLVTHKKRLTVYPAGGERYSADLTKFELIVTPFEGIPDSAKKQLEWLFEEAAEHLAADDRPEINEPERMAILYRSFESLPDELRGRVKDFMERFGTISDSPVQIAEFVDELANAVVPKLLPP